VQTDVDSIKALPNVFLLGQKSTKELPFYVKEFDVALIPYAITDYTGMFIRQSSMSISPWEREWSLRSFPR
jgi:hypothetical protein